MVRSPAVAGVCMDNTVPGRPVDATHPHVARPAAPPGAGPTVPLGSSTTPSPATPKIRALDRLYLANRPVLRGRSREGG